MKTSTGPLDLVIAYRIYPGVSKKPVTYRHSKYALAKLCADSLGRSLQGLNYKVYALMDNCPQEFDQLFIDAFGAEHVEFRRYDGVGNFATFKEQIRILLEQTESEYVYFAEDDYFYLDGQFKSMLDCLKNCANVDFLTPYEHPDFYNLKFHQRGDRSEFEYAGRTWKKTLTTCLTFLTTKTRLREEKARFMTYSKWSGDASLWAGITMGKDYFGLLREVFKLKRFEKWILIQMSIFFIPRFILNRKRNLYMASPSVGTHLESGLLGPNVDWQKEFDKHLG